MKRKNNKNDYRALSPSFKFLGNCNGVSIPRLIGYIDGYYKDKYLSHSGFHAICVNAPNDRWIVLCFLHQKGIGVDQCCSSVNVSFKTILRYFRIVRTSYYGFYDLVIK